MKLRGWAAVGVKVLAGFVPTLAQINEWAAAEGLPVPLVIDAADGVAMDRYSTILPGQLWLHRDWRMIGWGYRFPTKIQFKMEYTPEGADGYTHMRTFRVPLF